MRKMDSIINSLKDWGLKIRLELLFNYLIRNDFYEISRII